jgi:DNA-binding transcriptional ArsR family regulator
MIFGPLRGAFCYGNSGFLADPAQEFGRYLLDLDEMPSDQLRDNVLEDLRERLRRRVDPAATDHVPSAEHLLAERDTFVASYEHLTRTDPFTAPVDTELLHEAHALLHDPTRLCKVVLDYLFDIWERDENDKQQELSFNVEWGRIKRMVGWHAQMYARALHDLGDDIPLAEAFRELTGRDLPPEVAAALAGRREVVLLPCWHLGRWVLPWEVTSGVPRLCFSEPPNADVPLLRRTPVGRAELRARMAALADETRLRILELVRAHDEMTAQELVAALDLSQSNVSRHLNQLVQMGYLFQRRGEGANKTYRVSAYHLTRTAGALRRLGEGEPFEPEPQEADVTPELRRFVDREGRLTTWPPAHQRDKLLVLEYLAAAFEPGRVYSERELGEVLDRRSTIADHAALRRALYEFRFMNRARDGSRYWLSGTLPDDLPVEEPGP